MLHLRRQFSEQNFKGSKKSLLALCHSILKLSWGLSTVVSLLFLSWQSNAHMWTPGLDPCCHLN